MLDQIGNFGSYPECQQEGEKALDEQKQREMHFTIIKSDLVQCSDSNIQQIKNIQKRHQPDEIFYRIKPELIIENDREHLIDDPHRKISGKDIEDQIIPANFLHGKLSY